MTALSARCFLKNNKRKVCLLGFLFLLITICYFGEIYIFDSEKDMLNIMEMNDNITLVYMTDSESGEEFTTVQKKLERENKEYIEVGMDIVYGWKTALGFENSVSTYVFRTIEDLKRYNEAVHMMPNEIKMSGDGIIASELYTKNVGIRKGELLKEDNKYLYFQGKTYRLQETFEKDGYFLYAVDKDCTIEGMLCLGLSEEEIGQLEQEYPALGVKTKEQMTENIVSQFKVVNYIYYLVVMMTAIVLAITVYASFKGVWDKRRFEFSLYKAIGFGNFQILWKNGKEILSIAVLGSAAGMSIFMFIWYLMNQTVWKEAGLQFCYFSGRGMEILIMCDMLVLLPFFVSQIRTVCKLDITEY